MKMEFAFCVFLFGCLFFVNSDKLNGPTETTPEEFPYMAVVAGKWFCPAVIISRNHLLTPAVCVNGTSALTVYFGYRRWPYFLSSNQDPNTQTYNPFGYSIFIHENFSTTSPDHYMNNLAIIKLDQAIELGSTACPLKLISKEEVVLLKGGESGRVSGWFYLRDTVMQVEKVTLLNQDTCSLFYGSQFLDDQELCTYSTSSEYLDLLGNVLTVNNKIAGFMVNNYECILNSIPECHQTHIFLNFAPYLDWIAENVQVSVEELTNSDQEKDICFLEEIEVLSNKIKSHDAKRSYMSYRFKELLGKLKSSRENPKHNLEDQINQKSNKNKEYGVFLGKILNVRKLENMDYDNDIEQMEYESDPETITELQSENDKGYNQEQYLTYDPRWEINEIKVDLYGLVIEQKLQNNKIKAVTNLLDSFYDKLNKRLIQLEERMEKCKI